MLPGCKTPRHEQILSITPSRLPVKVFLSRTTLPGVSLNERLVQAIYYSTIFCACLAILLCACLAVLLCTCLAVLLCACLSVLLCACLAVLLCACMDGCLRCGPRCSERMHRCSALSMPDYAVLFCAKFDCAHFVVLRPM